MKYVLLDSGNCRKLEQVGDIRLVRPALNAFWQPSLAASEWNAASGVFTRDAGGGGSWNWKKKAPESWHVEWGGLKFIVKPTGFGHLGFFAEQHVNWDWLRKTVSSMGNKPKTLNLFAYSGASSLSMAQGGAEVFHLDSSKGMNDWAKNNLQLNSSIPDSIHWITDDVLKYTGRELRRERKYNGIVLDPPSFGRGAQGQVWKMENDLIKLMSTCRDIIDRSSKHFILLSCHSPGFTPVILERIIADVFGKGIFESGEMTVPESSGKMLPAGTYARYLGKG